MIYRFISFVILIALEILAVSLSVDASLIQGGSLVWLLSSMGFVLRWIIVFTALFIFITVIKNKFSADKLSIAKLKSFSYLYLFIHLSAFILFYLITLLIFGSEKLNFYPDNFEIAQWQLFWQLSWICLAFIVAISWSNLLFDFKHLVSILLINKSELFISAIAALLIILMVFSARVLWEPLSLITLNGAEWALSLIFDDIYIDVPQKILGIEHFIVQISPQCSGLEGLIIVLSVTAIYLYLLRKTLRFPLVYWLMPIAGLLAIFLNIIRVATLISIGALYSPEIAVGGFHSVAGWLTAIVASFLIIFVFSSINIFNKTTDQVQIQKAKANNQIQESDNNPNNNDAQLATAILIPFILFLAVSLVSNIFYQAFNYLYPLKVIVGIAGLAYFWSVYAWQKPQKWLEPLTAGIIVAVLWVILVPANPQYDLDFAQTIKAMPVWLMISWSLFRLIGFCLVAPILEELVFRGYLLARLSNKTLANQTVTNQKLSNKNELSISISALIISSLLFGFIHQNFVAGSIAGAIFALIRYRHNSLAEPIIAHMSANLLLAIWAIFSGQWVLL